MKVGKLLFVFKLTYHTPIKAAACILHQHAMSLGGEMG